MEEIGFACRIEVMIENRHKEETTFDPDKLIYEIRKRLNGEVVEHGQCFALDYEAKLYWIIIFSPQEKAKVDFGTSVQIIGELRKMKYKTG